MDAHGRLRRSTSPARRVLRSPSVIRRSSVVPFMINLVISMLIPRLLDVLCLLVGLHGFAGRPARGCCGGVPTASVSKSNWSVQQLPFPLPSPLREVIYSQMAGTGHECAEPVDKSPSESPRPLAPTGGHTRTDDGIIEPEALRRVDGSSVYMVAGSELFTSARIVAAGSDSSRPRAATTGVSWTPGLWSWRYWNQPPTGTP
jgi:hypothetical protein